MASYLTLKKSNCKNCYKCIRNCPVKSIRFSGNQAHIINDECILCGHCFVVCPQNAKEIVDDTEKVGVLLSSGDPVVVSLAPSFIANYEGVGIGAMEEALKKLGFAAVEETAIGATLVKDEYNRMLQDPARDVIISSCCPSVNLLIRKHFPHLLPYLADVKTPAMAHCLDIKRRMPNAKTVFIGPCVAKKQEGAESNGIIDAVLTFEELTQWLKKEHIELRKEMDQNPKSRARMFPTTGGVIRTMNVKSDRFSFVPIDGVENCIAALKDLESGKIHNCFIEMSSCIGSCANGPVMEKYHGTPVLDMVRVNRYAGEEDFEVEPMSSIEIHQVYERVETNKEMPTETQIEAILRKMGKFRKEQELNCGSCGYNSCREKAVAIFQGKADETMCLPYLKDKAESFSESISRNTPNGIIVVNEELEVQQINPAALKILNLRDERDVMGDPIVRIMDPTDYENVLRTGRSIYNERRYLAEYDRYVEETIVLDRDSKVLMCLLRDITDAEQERARKEEISQQTVEVADKVVEKQMMIVQEIAMLLGETAAETKIALTKLKESITHE